MYFNDGTNHYEFCESVHDYTIYTGTNDLTFILVWFSEYSHGNLTAFLSSSFCKPYYPEFSTSINRSNKQYIPSMIADPCSIYVCPALQKLPQRNFVFELGSMGSARITILHFNTLSSCEPEYAETNLENKSIIRLSAWAFDDWPLSVRSNVSHSLHNLTTIVVREFNYLVSAILHFPHICKPDMTRVQMAFFLTQSSCIEFPDGRIGQMPINNIPGLMYPCSEQIYDFTPTVKGPNNYVNFIYMDTGHINLGHLINVRYFTCPIECRNYRYSVYVRSEDNETVFQQTAYVGRELTAEHNHRGYRVSIIQPDQLCSQHMNCVLQLWVKELAHGSKGMKNVFYPSLHFNGKRYYIYYILYYILYITILYITVFQL